MVIGVKAARSMTISGNRIAILPWFSVYLLITVCVIASPAVVSGAELHIRVESGGQSEITVPPGFPVEYEIIGELSADSNVTLSSVCFELCRVGFDTGPESPPIAPPIGGDASPLEPMKSLSGTELSEVFVVDLWPVDLMSDMLTQLFGLPVPTKNQAAEGPAGGGYEVVLASGIANVPQRPGSCRLAAKPVYAHAVVARPGMDGVGRWQTVLVEGGGLSDLSITVSPGAVAIVDSLPPDGAIDACEPATPDGTVVFGWDILQLTVTGDASSLSPDDFVVTHTTDGPPPCVVTAEAHGRDVVIELSDMIELFAWTSIVHRASGSSVRLGYLPGDVDGSGDVSGADVNALLGHISGDQRYPKYRTDINRDGVVNTDDVSRLLDLLSGLSSYPVFQGEQLSD
jgi:hypothetical protein